MQTSPAEPPSRAFTLQQDAMLEQLRTKFGNPEITTDALQTWRDAGVLRRESTVYLVSQGTHSLVFVSSPRSNNGKPVLGKIYSSFLFDPYRRPYRFTGRPKAIAQSWEDRCIEQSVQAFDAALAPLFALGYAATTPDEVAGYVHTIETYRARLDSLRAGSSESKAVAAALGGVLLGLKGLRYPTIDGFLHDVCKGLLESLGQDKAERVVQDCFGDFAHANGDKGLVRREIWPMVARDSWRIDHDQLWALTVDNKLTTGSAVAHDWRDVLPNAEVAKTLTAAQVAGRKNLENILSQVMRYKAQPVSHDAVRWAFRQHLLGMWFFDERLQRNVAVNARDVGEDITRQQARAVQKKFFCTFHTLPHQRGPQRGNCNSVVTALLQTAMESEGQGAKPMFPKGLLPKVGKNHTVKLPRPKVLA